MKGHGEENADVQPVEKGKVLGKCPGAQLVSVKEGVGYLNVFIQLLSKTYFHISLTN